MFHAIATDAKSNPLTFDQRRMVATIWLTYALFYLGRVNFSPALDSLASSLSITRAEVGILGTALFWAYAVGQFINGELASHFSPHRIVTVGLVVVVLANLAMAAQTSLLAMAVIWGLNGFAQSTGWPPMLRIIAERLNATQVRRVSTIMPLSYVLGTAATWVIAGQIVALRGWQAAFWLPGLILLGVLIYWWRAAIDVPARATQTENQFRSGIVLRELRSLWVILLASLLVGVANIGTLIWLPTYVGDSGLFADSIVGFISGLMLMFAALGIYLAHSLVKRVESIFQLTSGLLGLSGLAFAIAIILPGRQEILALTIALVMLNGAGGLVVSSIPLILAREGRASSVTGSVNAAANIGGGIAGVGIGALVDGAGWQLVFLVWALCAFIAMSLIWLTRERESIIV